MRPRPSSADLAEVYVRSLISEGRLRPGDHVLQADVARALGCSRIPVREGLIALGRQGWVTVEPNRGTFVAALDEDALLDHYELFGVIYGFAARRALLRSDPRFTDELRGLAEASAVADDPAEFERLSSRFHDAIVDAAASSRTRVVLRALTPLVPAELLRWPPDAMALERKGLQAIARALIRRDGERATAEYALLMGHVGRMAVAHLRERGML